MNIVRWLIAYIMPSDSALGPGPFFYQTYTNMSAEMDTVIQKDTNMSAEMDTVIQKFERENYSENVVYFTVGTVNENGVMWMGNFKFTTNVRKYERVEG